MSVPDCHIFTGRVRSYEIGPDQRIKVRPIMHHLQEAASGHSREVGNSFPDQIRAGVVWVFSRVHLRMDRFPCWDERIRIETWSCEIGSLYATREFRIEDETGVCGAATTRFLLMDIAKRRPVRIPKNLAGKYNSRPVRIVDDPFDPLPGFEKPQNTREFHVRRGDLDSLNHVNYAMSVEWCLESLPAEWIEGKRLASVEIAYRKESVYGDNIRAESAQISGEDGVVTCLHRLVRGENGDVLTEGAVSLGRRFRRQLE